jgi:hypothetical protein
MEFKDRFSLRLGGGFGIGLCYYDPCDFYDEEYYSTYNDLTTINLVLGRGFNVNLGAEYMFTKNIGVQLNLKDFFGMPIKQTIHDFYQETDPRTINYRLDPMMLQVIPSLVLDLGLRKIDPYARFGLIIGAYPLIKNQRTEIHNGDTYEYSGKYTGNIPLGYSAAAGVKVSLKKNFSLFGEFECNGINYTPKTYKMIKYSVNGVDLLSTLPLKATQIDYVKNYDALVITSDDTPMKQLRTSFPFSNFEINIGAVYKF